MLDILLFFLRSYCDPRQWGLCRYISASVQRTSVYSVMAVTQGVHRKIVKKQFTTVVKSRNI